MHNKAFLLAAALAAATVSAAAATHAQASDARVGQWLDATETALHARLEKAHLMAGPQAVAIRFDIDGDRLRSPEVVKSSGFPDLDASVANALRGVAVGTPPAVLDGRTLIVRLAVGG
jgi:hypothetical protein